jgi:hypothetical protein
VGSTATLTKKNAQGVANSLLAATGGSKTVGVIYGIDRAVLFGSLALLLGGAVFLVAVWPRGRENRRAAWVVWAGWIGVLVTTVLGIALEGVYASGLSLSKVFDPSVFRDVLDARYGRSRSYSSRCSRSRSRCCGSCCTATANRRSHCRRGGWCGGARRGRVRGDARHRRSRRHRHPDRPRDPGRPRPRGGHGVLARRSRGAVRRGVA